MATSRRADLRIATENLMPFFQPASFTTSTVPINRWALTSIVFAGPEESWWPTDMLGIGSLVEVSRPVYREREGRKRNMLERVVTRGSTRPTRSALLVCSILFRSTWRSSIRLTH